MISNIRNVVIQAYVTVLLKNDQKEHTIEMTLKITFLSDQNRSC